MDETEVQLEAGRSPARATCGPGSIQSEESAVRAAEAMNSKQKVRKPLEAYPCYWCEGWHIGRAMSTRWRSSSRCGSTAR